MTVPLTIDGFVEHFRECTGWQAEEGTRIWNELVDFAKEREGSTRDIDELHVIFCMSKSIAPYSHSTKHTEPTK